MPPEIAPEVVFPHLGITLEHLPRAAFTIFGFPVYFYGVFIATGMVAGLIYGLHEARRTGQRTEKYTDLLLIGIVAALIGARLYYVIFTWQDYAASPLEIFDLRKGGLAIYGGLIASVIAAAVFCRVNRLKFLVVADTCAPAFVLGQAIGRWGNFFNREAFGGYTDGLFAMRYLSSQASIVPKSLAAREITANGAQYIQVHPTFLYESMWCVGAFILLNIWKRRAKASGEVMGAYFVLYGLGRAWIEGLRQDQLLIWGTDIAVSQVLSFALVAIGIVIIIIRRSGSGKAVLAAGAGPDGYGSTIQSGENNGDDARDEINGIQADTGEEPPRD